MTKLILTKPRGRNKFCGPIAMSATLNITSHYAAKLIREANNLTAIKGLYTSELTKTLTKNNVKFRVENIDTTFNQFSKLGHSTLMILVTRDHFFAFDGEQWTDSGAWAKKRKLYAIDQFPSPKVKVKKAIFIDSHAIIEPKEETKAKRKPTCFADLIEFYANPDVKNEIIHYEDFVAERIDNHFGDGTYIELDDIEENIQRKYVEMLFELEDSTSMTNKDIRDQYLWDLFDDVTNSIVMTREDQANIRTILMLNGKYKFVKNN